MIFQLVDDYISRDVIEALTSLLEGAVNGDVTGIAFAATLRKNRYITNVAGYCYKQPTLARGCIGALDDELSAIIHQRDPQDTR